MATAGKVHWGRVLLAILAAEILPLVLLTLVVIVYAVFKQPGSLSPEEFAPQAGLWVGPIGGFFSVLLFSYWAARGATSSPVAHGLAVGIVTALIDFSLGMMMGGGSSFAILAIVVASNCGRILAGGLGGWFAARRSQTA